MNNIYIKGEKKHEMNNCMKRRGCGWGGSADEYFACLFVCLFDVGSLANSFFAPTCKRLFNQQQAPTAALATCSRPLLFLASPCRDV